MPDLTRTHRGMDSANLPRETGPEMEMPIGLGHSPRRARWRWPLRAAFWGLMVAFFALGAGFVLFADHISRLNTPTIAARADGIIVLTGGQARLTTAVELLKAGKGERLLITGVNPDAARGDLPTILGLDKALFDCCVDIDTAADTVANAEESSKWIAERGYDDVIVVTNNYHMPRSLMELTRQTDGVRLHPYPVVNTDLGDGSWLQRPQAVRVLLTEYVKFVAAVSRGLLHGSVNGISAASVASLD